MEFETLTNEAKITIIEQTIAQLETEIYRSCLVLNIDPNTLDPDTYTYSVPVERHEYVLIKNSIDSLVVAKAKLAELR
jgi:hypothetical protein